MYLHGRLTINNDGKKTIVDLARYCKGIKRIGLRLRLVERLLRLEPRTALRIDGGFLVSWQGKILLVNDDGSVSMEHSFRQGMNNPLSLVVINGLESFSLGVYYGEYWGNTNREAVAIWRRDFLGKWEKAYEFQPGSIQHIHGIVPDQKNDRVFILTGDMDEECYFWEAKDNFQTVRKYAGGSQQYRACVAHVDQESIIYATDTPNEDNYIYRLTNPLNKPERIAVLQGTCIYGAALHTSRGEKYFAFISAVEPDVTLSGWRYRITSRLGQGIKDCYSHITLLSASGEVIDLFKAKKDWLPLWLFQFGNFRVADTDSMLAVTGQALSKYDNRTLEFDI